MDGGGVDQHGLGWSSSLFVPTAGAYDELLLAVGAMSTTPDHETQHPNDHPIWAMAGRGDLLHGDWAAGRAGDAALELAGGGDQEVERNAPSVASTHGAMDGGGE